MEKNCDDLRGSGSIHTSSLQSVRKKLNTKGCCFLCLTVISNDPESATWRPLVSLKILQRYFEISRQVVQNEVPPPPVTLDSATAASQIHQQNIEAELCTICTRIHDKFREAFLSLEKAQMEMDYWSGRVHHQVSGGSENPELVQNYSKRMTSDLETLVQLVFVDYLRKEIARKSITKQAGSETKICLPQLKWTPMKQVTQTNKDGGTRSESWESDSFNGDIDPEDEQSTHQFCMDEDNEGINVASPSIAYVKEEIKIKIEPPLHIPSIEPPSFPLPESSRETTQNPFIFAKMFVKNQKTGSFTCTSCYKELTTKRIAKVHYEAIHSGRKFTCQVCQSQFRAKGYLSKHKKNCNGKKRTSSTHRINKIWQISPQTGKYTCALCAKQFGTLSGAHKHYNASHLKIEHKCEICNMAAFFNYNHLTRHQKKCEATLKKRLSQRLRMETDPKFKFHCSADSCGKRFEFRALLERHFRNVHMKERNHSCDVCGKKYSTAHKMRHHKKAVHSGENVKRFLHNFDGKQSTESMKNYVTSNTRKTIKIETEFH